MARAYFSGFDAHTHLDFPCFDSDRDEVCRTARRAGVEGWVIAAADPIHWPRVSGIAAKTGGIAVLGVHPWWVGPDHEAWMADLAERPLQGIGETGLDYARARTDEARAGQRRSLRDHLAIARKRGVPVVLHCVRAWPDLLGILRRDGLPDAGGMVHGWTGDPHATRAAIEAGLHVSYGPAATRERSRRAREAVLLVDARRLLVETDCPDQANAGPRGTPADLVAVVEAVASIRGEEPTALAARCAGNARRLFGAPG